jgi:hypothetical protein
MQKIPKKQHPKYYPDIIEKINNSKTINKQNKRKSKYKLMEEKHKNALEKIAKNPAIIGIKESIYTEIEKKIYYLSKEVGEIDGIIINNFETYFLEYKCNDCETNRKKAKYQLEKIPKFIEEKYKTKSARYLYVYGKFEVEELTKNGFRNF